MRFVAHKSVEQQNLQSLHRIRDLLIKQRTSLTNQIGGLLGEYGITIPLGLQHIKKQLPVILENKTGMLSANGVWIFGQLQEQRQQLQERIETMEEQIKAVFNANDAYKTLNNINGIGVLTATALVSSVGNAKEFKNGRQFAAWLGLVPKQNSSGGKTRMLGITKQGNAYLRRLLVHGARSALYWAKKGSSPLSRWLIHLENRVGTNRAVVALANKNARIAWALLAKGVPFNEEMAYQPAK